MKERKLDACYHGQLVGTMAETADAMTDAATLLKALARIQGK